MNNNELKQNLFKLLLKSTKLERVWRNRSYITTAYLINFTLHTHSQTYPLSSDSLRIGEVCGKIIYDMVMLDWRYVC